MSSLVNTSRVEPSLVEKSEKQSERKKEKQSDRSGKMKNGKKLLPFNRDYGRE